MVDTSVPRGCATVVVGGLKGTPAIVVRLLNFELVSLLKWLEHLVAPPKVALGEPM